MIILHQYPAIWGLSSLSPFCIKVEMFLKHHKLSYRVVVEKNPARGPKGKMPFIRDGEQIIADSTMIINYLTRTYDLKNDLDPLLEAQGLAFQRLVEEHLYFILLYSRWIDPTGWKIIKKEFTQIFPPLIGLPFLYFIRLQLKKQAHAQGLGRHSINEIYEIGHKDLTAISQFLADKPYFLGQQFSAIDATLYSFLVTILKQPIESQLQKSVKTFPNLLAYVQKIDHEEGSVCDL